MGSLQTPWGGSHDQHEQGLGADKKTLFSKQPLANSDLIRYAPLMKIKSLLFILSLLSIVIPFPCFALSPLSNLDQLKGKSLTPSILKKLGFRKLEGEPGFFQLGVPGKNGFVCILLDEKNEIIGVYNDYFFNNATMKKSTSITTVEAKTADGARIVQGRRNHFTFNMVEEAPGKNIYMGLSENGSLIACYYNQTTGQSFYLTPVLPFFDSEETRISPAQITFFEEKQESFIVTTKMKGESGREITLNHIHDLGFIDASIPEEKLSSYRFYDFKGFRFQREKFIKLLEQLLLLNHPGIPLPKKEVTELTGFFLDLLLLQAYCNVQMRGGDLSFGGKTFSFIARDELLGDEAFESQKMGIRSQKYFEIWEETGDFAKDRNRTIKFTGLLPLAAHFLGSFDDTAHEFQGSEKLTDFSPDILEHYFGFTSNPSPQPISSVSA